MSIVKISQAQGRIPVTVFHIQDRVNMGNIAELERTAKDSYANGMHDLILDLSLTPSITSVGIRTIVSIYKMLSHDNVKHLKLANLSPQIRETLHIAGIDEHIEFFDTVDEALASF